MAEQDFGGAKIALLHQGQVLVYRRDCRDDIPWPGQWDLPGGGREGRKRRCSACSGKPTKSLA
ncbi:hypothetical protein GGER_15270 [Serratia rubidaea]